MKIALIGNPNCGKTTIFNLLTGAKQKVGNWSGVTVEKKYGIYLSNHIEHELIDLPGIYSLEQVSPSRDEAISAQFLKDNSVDLVINVIDASNLARSLILTTQLIELGYPILILANMVDVATQTGLETNFEALSRKLQTSIIPFIGAKGSGLEELNAYLASKHAFSNRQKHLPFSNTSRDKTPSLIAEQRFNYIQRLLTGIQTQKQDARSLTEAIDNIVLNRYLGIPIFLLMMYAMFSIAINFGSAFIDFFDILFGAIFVDGLAHLLSSLNTPIWLITLLCGLGSGIQLVATFIPVIAFLYLSLSFLEDSGYLSRAAFVIDKLMSKIGLPGNAFVPLIVGFGCNVPAVMAARTMNREADRLLTILMAPFMSCGARLTVYALFATAFFSDQAALVIFSLYLLGIAIAVFSGWLFRKHIFQLKPTPSFIEMPAYHLPIWRNIVFTTWHRLRGFLTRAGKTIILVVALLSMISSISLDGSFGHENSESSALSVIGKTITPIFYPIGIKEENWPAAVGIFTGIFAKEAIVGTLDALYDKAAPEESDFNLLTSLGDAFQSIPDNMASLFSTWADPLGIAALSDPGQADELSKSSINNLTTMFSSEWSAFCYLVLILLYTPCVAVLGTIDKEAGKTWMWIVIGWTSFVAYGFSSIMYQLAQLFSKPLFAVNWIAFIVLVLYLCVRFLRHTVQKPNNKFIPLVMLDS